MILINFMSYGENIYPSISRICEELNISRPTCVKKIKALKDNGYLKVTKNKSLNGDYDNNSYEVVKNINHLVKEFNYGSKNNLPQVVKEINSNNTNKTILNNNIYSSLENELDTKEIEKDLIKKINSKYSKELIKEELEKLKDKDISKLDLLKELDKNLKSKSKDNSNQDISTIFDYWNSKGIIKHKELKEDTKKAIKKAIKNYSINEIKQAIDTYSEILKSEYYFNYKWNLKDFLNRNNAISTFMEDGSNKANYEEWKNKNKPKEEPKLKNNISNFDY
ncbi:MarR family transcriptional regulator [Clostridium perfringens]|nr:MarR family transcriptional regulator [Clostridium perfringens]